MTIKRNAGLTGAISGRYRPTGFSGFTIYNNPGVNSSEVIETYSHHRVNGHWSGGGPMELTRDWSDYLTPFTRGFAQNGTTILHEGTSRIVAPLGGISNLATFTHPSGIQLAAMGATAIARTMPTNPSFDLSTFLGELRMEGIPNLPGSAVKEQTRAAKAAGSEYLNLEFGWLPLVRGLRDFANTVEQSHKILSKYQQESNQVLQRSYQFPYKSATKLDSCSFTLTPDSAGFASGTLSQTALQRIWFEAEYVYRIPTGPGVSDKIARYASYARKLYGIELTPEVVWNLSPWSWAADWFGNMGDVMHNVSSLGQDGLVMRHAYIMAHTQWRWAAYAGRSGAAWRLVRTIERKSRLPTSPFGFGISYSGLTPKQIAIAASLGLSRW